LQHKFSAALLDGVSLWIGGSHPSRNFYCTANALTGNAYILEQSGSNNNPALVALPVLDEAAPVPNAATLVEFCTAQKYARTYMTGSIPEMNYEETLRCRRHPVVAFTFSRPCSLVLLYKQHYFLLVCKQSVPSFTTS
jgi:hypothetical protein